MSSRRDATISPARSPSTRASRSAPKPTTRWTSSSSTGGPRPRTPSGSAAGKALVLEMGGNGPIVVLEDANLDAAVEAAVTACFLCAGQSCTAGERLLVHREVRDAFAEKLARRVTAEVLLGDPRAPETTM